MGPLRPRDVKNTYLATKHRSWKGPSRPIASHFLSQHFFEAQRGEVVYDMMIRDSREDLRLSFT